MREFWTLLLGAMLAAIAIDYGCQSVTNDRCTFGIPNPTETTK